MVLLMSDEKRGFMTFLGVFMLKLSDGQDSTVSLLTGQDTVINFDYVADIASFEAILDNSIALDTQAVQNNIQSKTYQFSLSPTMISGYGIHQILFRLTSEMSVKEVKVEVNFEENISQFQVYKILDCSKHSKLKIRIAKYCSFYFITFQIIYVCYFMYAIFLG